MINSMIQMINFYGLNENFTVLVINSRIQIKLHDSDDKLLWIEWKLHCFSDKLQDSDDKLHDSGDKLLWIEWKLHCLSDKLQGSDDKLHDSDDKLQSSDDQLHDSDDKLHDSDDKLKGSDDKPHDSDDKLQGSVYERYLDYLNRTDSKTFSTKILPTEP